MVVPIKNTYLETMLSRIFYRTVLRDDGEEPDMKEVEEVVSKLVETMEEMKLTIVPSNLLKEEN